MYTLYNIALYVGFLLLTPRFLYDKLTGGKWAAGFNQRLGNVPTLDHAGRIVVLLHCVSVGEANAALPLAKKLKERFPDIALVVSTTTKTGQAVARSSYAEIANEIVYFPFDLGWAAKRFLSRVRPDLVLLTETELWFNFIRLAKQSHAKVVVVNGRLSAKSFGRYARIRNLMKRVLGSVDLALMQGDADAERVISLGADTAGVHVTGNLKFDIDGAAHDSKLTDEFRTRFGIDSDRPLILAASTHSPEERLLLEAFEQVRQAGPSRLMLVPRHPERFQEVADVVAASGLTLARRSNPPSDADERSDVILLDSIGELKSLCSLAEIVFVGGSLIPHGGQSVFEPGAAGTAIVTGPHTANFDAAVKEFISQDALIQLRDADVTRIAEAFEQLLANSDRRRELGRNARSVIEANRGAADRTVEYLVPFLTESR